MIEIQSLIVLVVDWRSCFFPIPPFIYLCKPFFFMKFL